MKRTFIPLVFASSLVISPGFADETGKSALDVWIQSNTQIGMEMSYRSAEEDGDLLTVREFTASYSTTLEPGDEQSNADGVTFELSWITPTLEVNEFASDRNGFSFERMALSDGTRVTARLTSKSDDDVVFDATIEGYEVLQAAWPYYPEIAEDARHQVSRWIPLLEQVLDYRVGEYKVDRLALTIQQDGESDDPAIVQYEVLDLALSDLRDGLIGEYSSGRSTQIISGDDGDDFASEVTMRIASTRLVDYDLGAFLTLLNPLPGDDPALLPAIGSMVMLGYDIDADPVRFNIDRIAYEDIHVGPPETSLLPLLDSSLSGEEIDPVEFGLALFDTYRSMAIGRFSVDGVTASFPDPDNPDTTASFNMGQLLVSNLDAEGLDEFSISSVGFDMGTNGAFSLGKMSIGDIEFAPYGPMKTFIKTAAYADQEPDPLEIARLFAPLSISTAMKDLYARIPGEGELSLEGYFLGLSSAVPPVPTGIEIAVDGLEIPVDSLDDSEAEALFAAAGIETLRLSESLRLHWDEDSQDLVIDNLMVELGEIGTVSARATLGGIPRSILENPHRIEAVIATLNLKGLEMELINQGGVETAFSLYAAQQGLDESQLNGQLLNELDGLVRSLGNDAFADQVSGAAERFFANPQSLRVRANPQNPVPVIQILANLEIAPGSIPDLLDLRIDANP
ncbi:MAG: hypothetical protein NXI27_26180 [Alphaproteobacteria bacterium]|nr:hypothetical protein [Alphaproteobacteria bacterium]